MMVQTRTSISSRYSRGFTLLEVLLAMFVFVTAVLALVEAINLGGLASVESRMGRHVHDRMNALLLEATRQPKAIRPDVPFDQLELNVEENGVKYHLKSERLQMKNAEGVDIPELYEVKVRAVWSDAGQPQQAEASTWVWPPLYLPPNQM